MPEYDPRMDAYIAKAPEFARPILEHLRDLIHRACPQVEETMKWSMPHFDYKKEMMCSMAAFKNHCAFSFWKGAILPDPKGYLTITERDAMGNLGQIKSLADLPPDEALVTFIHEAMRMNDEGIKLPRPPKATERAPLEAPQDLLAALAANPTAKEQFEAFSYSNKKDYIEWIVEAKSQATREKRIAQAVEQIAEGKSKHWKYQR